MQKQIFIAWKTIFKKKTADPGFFPYKYGAYSKTIDDSIEVLKKLGLIRVKPGKGEGVQYFITPKGKRSVTKKLKRMKLNVDELKKNMQNKYPVFVIRVTEGIQIIRIMLE